MSTALAGALRGTPEDSSANTAPRGLVKLSLNLQSETLEAVERIAQQRRVTKTEVMRRAIAVLLFLEDIRATEGSAPDVFVRRQGLLQQVVFPWFQ